LSNQTFSLSIFAKKTRSLNFHNTKVKYVRNMTKEVVEKFNGEVPEGYKDLLSLSGVGPKIANLMRSVSFGKEDAGIVVDTHVFKLTRDIGWVPPPSSSSSSSSSLGVSSRPLSGKYSMFNKTSSSKAIPQVVKGEGKLSTTTYESPERTRLMLESWVPLEERMKFSLNVIGFSQIVRRASTPLVQEGNQPKWAVEFLKFVEKKNCGKEDDSEVVSYQVALSMVHRLIAARSNDKEDDEEESVSLKGKGEGVKRKLSSSSSSSNPQGTQGTQGAPVVDKSSANDPTDDSVCSSSIVAQSNKNGIRSDEASFVRDNNNHTSCSIVVIDDSSEDEQEEVCVGVIKPGDDDIEVEVSHDNHVDDGDRGSDDGVDDGSSGESPNELSKETANDKKVQSPAATTSSHFFFSQDSELSGCHSDSTPLNSGEIEGEPQSQQSQEGSGVMKRQKFSKLSLKKK
jgi:endonuclease III